MQTNDETDPTTSDSESANACSARLRARVEAALEQGDRSGRWATIARPLDAAEAAHEQAERQLEIGEALLDRVRR